MPPPRAVPSHYLRGNAKQWTPRRVLVFDTETETQGRGDREVLALRCWCAAAIDRRGPEAGTVETGAGTTRAELAAWVDAHATTGGATWLYCHNLAFDLTTSGLIEQLTHPRFGWELTAWNMGQTNCSGRLRKAKSTLALADLWSIVPAKLEAIGRMVGVDKWDWPGDGAPLDRLADYCANDVAVTARAVLDLMEWWDEGDLGMWALSGPGLGTKAMRHRLSHPPGWNDPDADGIVDDPPPKPRPIGVVIDTDPVGIADDRAAVHGGRRDVTRVGDLGAGPFAHLDFADAYLTACRHLPLPAERGAHYNHLGPDSRWLAAPDFGVVASCEVETDVPRYPLRTPQGTFHPIGRFTTTLCTPEIRWAARSGHLRDVGPGWTHRLRPWMAPWAEWIAGLLDPAAADVPSICRAMAKQWGRSVPSRFAMQIARVEDKGWAEWPTAHVVDGWDDIAKADAAEVHIGGRFYWYVFDQEPDDSYPAVLAFVQSYLRTALGMVLEALGEDLWVACDTDGCWVDLSRAAQWLSERWGRPCRYRNPVRLAEAVCEALGPVCAPFVIRPKAWRRQLVIAGPQHYRTEREDRAAGRPSHSEVGADGSERYWTWPQARWQLEHGDPAGFVRVSRRWAQPLVTARRWILDDGRALPPIAVSVNRDESGIAPWPASWGSDPGYVLGPEQSPVMARLS